MLTLPRGAFNGRENVPLSSAEWARPSVVSRHAYKGDGALFMGASPYEDTWDKLVDLMGNVHQLRESIEQRNTHPLKRAAELGELEQIWRSALLADCLPLGVTDDRHTVTIAGARSGKGLSAIVPNLCLYSGSVVCLDPKGENATLTAARRGQGDDWAKGMGQDVYVIDPFSVADVPESLRASLNPLALLDKHSPLVVDDAALLAEGLILGGGDHEAHWTETARNLVKGVILYLVDTDPDATLLDLRRLLTIGDKKGFERERARLWTYQQALESAEAELKSRGERDPFIEWPERPDDLMPDSIRNPFAYLLWKMEQSTAFDGVIAGTAESILGTGENERGSILSTARRNTAFLDTIAASFKETLSGKLRPFDPDELKANPRGVTVYLCLPAARMGTHGRWLRLLIGLFLERIQRQLIPPACGSPVLFLLEEFFALGEMPAIEKAAGYAAGFGLKLWIILQDIQQLKALYKTSWQTFLANAGAVQIFGASDKDTLDYASQAMGEIEVSRVTSSLSHNEATSEAKGSELARLSPHYAGSKTVHHSFITMLLRGMMSDKSTSQSKATTENYNTGLHVVPLLRPDEIAQHFARESGAALLLIKGERPIWTMRVNYFDSPWLQGLYTPLPEYRAESGRGNVPRDMWERPKKPFEAVANAFNALANR